MEDAMSKKRAAGRSLAEWDRLVDEWSASGEKQESFAISRGINPRTFQGKVWRSRKRRGLTVKGKEAPCHFVEVSAGTPVETGCGSGCRITMSKTEIEFSSSAEAEFVFQILSKLGHGR
jgi:hypothetical protein